MRGPEVIVVGGGTMGLAVAWALARGGARVRVLERYSHVHARGSHSGFTRIIRESYHEGAGYVPLVRRADALWQELQARVGERLLVRTGMFECGPPEDHEFAAVLAACRSAGVEHEVLDAVSSRRRFPLVVPEGWLGCYTPSGAYLRIGPCLDALRQEAMSLGAEFHYGVEVRAITPGARPQVTLASGEVLAAERVVVTAGAHLPGLLPDFLPGRLKVLRRVMAWTRPAAAEVPMLAGLPVWGVFAPEGFFYGFPHNREGVEGFKLALHVPAGGGEEAGVHPEQVEYATQAADLAPLVDFLGRYLPAARGEFIHTAVCLYTCTPSWDFAIDHVPGDRKVWVAGGFSGHGFKFAPAIGELVAAAALTGETPAALHAFARTRHV